MMWWHGDWNGWAWLAMSASMLAFWGLAIWGAVTVIRNSYKAPGKDAVGVDASRDPNRSCGNVSHEANSTKPSTSTGAKCSDDDQ